MSKVVNLNKKAVVDSITQAGVAAVGFGAGQALLSKFNKPVGDIGGFAAGVALATSKNPHVSNLGKGLAIVSGIRLVNRFSTPKDGAAPSSVQSMISKFVPNLQGLGQLGELGYALAASPTVSYDTEGNVMGLEGLYGDEDLNGEDQFEGFDGAEESLLGIEETANSLL